MTKGSQQSGMQTSRRTANSAHPPEESFLRIGYMAAAELQKGQGAVKLSTSKLTICGARKL